MSTINRSFSIPKELDAKLHAAVKHRSMSKFVVDAVREKLAAYDRELQQHYILANSDKGQEECRNFEGTLADGLGVHNDW